MFLNPAILAGIGGAMIPLVLHLLSRARYRSVDWGAMMFLQNADARQRQSAWLKQLILLLLRMAIVAALAVALARPIVHGAWGGIAREGRVTAAIILDRSASMAYPEGDRPRLHLARDAARQVLENLRKGDQVVLLSLGEQQGSASDENLEPSSDLEGMARTIDSLPIVHGSADLAATIVRAADVLDANEQFNRELYIICDRQASNWSQVNEAFESVWRQQRAQSRTPMRVFVIPVGGAGADNVAIEAVEVLNPPAIAGQSAEIEVRVRNYGTVARADLPVTLALDDKPVDQKTLYVAPGAANSIRTRVTFPPAAGSHVVSATIQGSGLPTDDARDAAVNVIPPIGVLLISGDERAGPFRSESSFAQLALAPFATTKATGADPAAVTVITPDKWTPGLQQNFAVTILANVGPLSDVQARELEQYVYDGGRLVVAPGAVTPVESLNVQLHRGGQGILPAMLLAPTPPDGSRATRLEKLELTHPIFRFQQSAAATGLAATIGRYFPVAAQRADARVLASFASGDPYLLESTPGRGRVILLTTPLDADWNTLPLTNFYLPFLQSIVKDLASQRVPSHTLSPGQAIRTTLSQELPNDDAASITLPDGKTDTPAIARLADRTELSYANTAMPGRYRIEVKRDGGAVETMQFVVNAPAVESDLTPLPDERWTWLTESLGFQRIELRETSVADATAGVRHGRELWPALLAAVMLLCVVELAVARAWSQGEQ